MDRVGYINKYGTANKQTNTKVMQNPEFARDV